jgi:hypothetical protein
MRLLSLIERAAGDLYFRLGGVLGGTQIPLLAVAYRKG